MPSSHQKLRLFYIALAVGLGLSGCAVTVPPLPTTAVTSMSAPKTFGMSEDFDLSPDERAVNWWAGFEDPLMTDLISTALAHNKTLAAAQANVETAEALLRSQALSGSVTTRSTGSVELGRAAAQGGNPNVSAFGSLFASWEYDRFGRIAALIQRAEFDVQTAQETRRDIAVTITAETATAYIDLRGAQMRRGVARENTEIQREGLELLETLFENGRANKLDTERAESQFRTTLATLPALEADIRNAMSRLTALTGRTLKADSDIKVETLQRPADIPQLQTALFIGSPQDMIRRRPDIRAAETEIGALLSLGSAERARLFPIITLGADISSVFREGVSLGDSFGFGIGPSLIWEGPDLRQVYADIDVADARVRAAVSRYEASVITALNEVEVALTNYTQEHARLSNLIAAASSAERAVDLARLRFEEGLDDYLDVIDAQRTLLTTQDTLERSRIETSRRAIAAYRSLGGIWSADLLDKAVEASNGQNLQGSNP